MKKPDEYEILERAHRAAGAHMMQKSPRADELIACLEGEIAKRDETIARLEPQLNRAIQANYDLREELAACRVAVENCEVFRARIVELEAEAAKLKERISSRNINLANAIAELAAIKAQEPVAFCDERTLGVLIGGKAFSVGVEPALSAGPSSTVALYAAPVFEAKAQPVSAAYCSVTCIESVQVGQLRYEDGRTYDVKGHSPAGVDVYADDAGSFSTFNNPAFNKHFNVATYRTAPVSAQAEAKAHGVIDFVFSGELPNATFVEVEDGNGNSINVGEWFKRDDGYSVLRLSVLRLNAAPVQQVSVPDVSAMARILADRNAEACNVNCEDNWAIYGQDYIDDVTAMLAAPAAPAADAGLVEALEKIVATAFNWRESGARAIGNIAVEALAAHRDQEVL